MRRTAVWKWAAGAMVASVAIAGMAFAQSTQTSNTEPGWLGVYTQELTDELREGLGVQANGLLVNQVVDDSPADKAGLRKGDVILSFNDRAVESTDGFTEMVRARKAGDTVALRILRDGNRQTISVKLGARSEWSADDGDDDDDGDSGFRMYMPDERELRRLARDFSDGKGFEFSLGHGRLGVRVQDMNKDLGEYFKVPNGEGALVLEVVDGSAAEKAGFRSGDVIVKVGDDAVEDSEDLIREIREREGKVAFEVLRRGTKQTLTAELDEPLGARTHRGHRSFAFDGEGPTVRIQGDEAQLRREMENLRRELDQLRRELQELRRK